MRIIKYAVLLFLLTACAGVNSIRSGKTVDWVYSVEPRLSGKVYIWTRYSDVSAFCTDNMEFAQVAEKAMLANHRALFMYHSIDWGSKGAEVWAGCTPENKRDTIYWLESIRDLEEK